MSPRPWDKGTMEERHTEVDGRGAGAAAAAAPVEACIICGNVCAGVQGITPHYKSHIRNATTAEEEQAATQALVSYQQRVLGRKRRPQPVDVNGFKCDFAQCAHLTVPFKTLGGLKTHQTRMHKGDPAAKVYTVVDVVAPGGGGRSGTGAAMGPG